MTAIAVVRQMDADGRWEVAWKHSDSSFTPIADFPDQARAWSYADLITAIRPLDDDLSELKARMNAMETRCAGLEQEGKQ